MGLLVENTVFEVFLFFTTLFTIGYLYTKHAYSYWTRNNVRSPFKPSFPFGNLTQLFLSKTSLSEFLCETYDSTKEDFIGIYAIFRPILLVRSSELCRNILVKDFQYFHDRGIYANEKIDPLSKQLFSQGGDKWKQMRVKFTPTFTSGRLKAMFPTLIDCCNSLEKHLKMKADGNDEIEMRDLMARFTTNVIASVAFGIEVDSIQQPNAPFRVFGRKLLEPTLINGIRNVLIFFLPKVAELIKLKTVNDDYEKFIFSVVKQTIDYRENNNIERKDFMQLLLQLRNIGEVNSSEEWNFTTSKDNIKKLSISEIAAQVHVFFVAGFETSSTVMSFCLYEMARNPHIQEKVQQEIDQVLKKHEGKWTYDAMMEMKYLDCCIDETLRMYTPVPLLNRECSADYQIPGTDIIIKKGTAVFIPIIGYHYDPQYFPNPTTFQPERFTDGNQNLDSFCYLPFGEGPRTCVGLRLGKMQAKLGLAVMLCHFKLHLGEKLKHNKMQYAPGSFVPSALGGLNLRVSHRKL